MTATHRADMITELEEVRASLTWDVINADRQATSQRDSPSMHESANMRTKRLAYADAIAAVGTAAVAYCAAIQRGLDQLRGVR